MEHFGYYMEKIPPKVRIGLGMVVFGILFYFSPVEVQQFGTFGIKPPDEIGQHIEVNPIELDRLFAQEGYVQPDSGVMRPRTAYPDTNNLPDGQLVSQ